MLSYVDLCIICGLFALQNGKLTCFFCKFDIARVDEERLEV